MSEIDEAQTIQKYVQQYRIWSTKQGTERYPLGSILGLP